MDAVTDAWIDSLFNEFDADGSHTIDDAEWDRLVAVLLTRVSDLAPSPFGKQLDIEQCREMVRWAQNTTSDEMIHPWFSHANVLMGTVVRGSSAHVFRARRAFDVMSSDW